MAGHVCPWWGSYLIDNPLRRLVHDFESILGPYVKAGMTALDVGCGSGFFSIAMARMVGDEGRVIAIDLQKPMLDILVRRAGRAGVAHRIHTHKCQQHRLGIDVQVDFALAFAMVHEVPDQRRLLSEIYDCLKVGAVLLLAEPQLHVPGKAFHKTVATAEELAFRVADQPKVRWCRAVALERVG
jgi:ubiquinone/menaquinone biosynthesis C-methylase UbiE